MMIKFGLAGVSALIFTAAVASAQDAPLTISGTVQNKAGVDGTKIVACSMQVDGCKTRTKARLAPNGANSAGYILELPGPGPYQILAHKDMDGDGKSTAGDYLAIANSGGDVQAPAKNVSLKMFKVSPELVAAAAAPPEPPVEAASVSDAVTGSAGGLAGNWSQESDATEAVMRTKLEDRPAIVTSSGRYGWEGGGGFNLGGVTQYSRTIMRDKLVPIRVQRQMNLQVGADGGFKWDIAKVEIDDNCRKTIRQQKIGRLSANGQRMTFRITGGQESRVSDCGSGPEDAWSGAIDPTEESYNYQQNGSTIMVDGSGEGWLFRKS